MPVLVDTNVLLRLRDTADPDHPACVQLVEAEHAVRHDLRMCAQVMIEYWAAATRPATVNGMGVSVADARSDLMGFSRFLPMLPEPENIAEHWLAIVTR